MEKSAFERKRAKLIAEEARLDKELAALKEDAEKRRLIIHNELANIAFSYELPKGFVGKVLIPVFQSYEQKTKQCGQWMTEAKEYRNKYFEALGRAAHQDIIKTVKESETQVTSASGKCELPKKSLWTRIKESLDG